MLISLSFHRISMAPEALCRRLRSLGLEEGCHWRYMDVEDFSPDGGAEARMVEAKEQWS